MVAWGEQVMPPEQKNQFALALVDEARSDADLAAMHATLTVIHRYIHIYIDIYKYI